MFQLTFVIIAKTSWHILLRFAPLFPTYYSSSLVPSPLLSTDRIPRLPNRPRNFPRKHQLNRLPRLNQAVPLHLPIRNRPRCLRGPLDVAFPDGLVPVLPSPKAHHVRGDGDVLPERGGAELFRLEHSDLVLRVVAHRDLVPHADPDWRLTLVAHFYPLRRDGAIGLRAREERAGRAGLLVLGVVLDVHPGVDAERAGEGVLGCDELYVPDQDSGGGLGKTEGTYWDSGLGHKAAV